MQEEKDVGEDGSRHEVGIDVPIDAPPTSSALQNSASYNHSSLRPSDALASGSNHSLIRGHSVGSAQQMLGASGSGHNLLGASGSGHSLVDSTHSNTSLQAK